MSAETEAVAVIAALEAALPDTAHAYDYDEVPATLPAMYVVVDFSRRFVPDRLSSGEATVVCGRLVTRYVAKTVSNARELRRIVSAALEDKAVTVGSSYVGPFTFEADESIGPDDGWYSGSDSWAF